MKAITHYVAAHAATVAAEELRLIRAAAPAFRDWFKATGRPDYVDTFDLASVPYPTRFGTFGAAWSPLPYVTITNRMIVVRWRDDGGKSRTLLFEPTDLDLARNAPFYVKVAEKTPAMVQRLVYKEHGTVETHLAALGIRPEDVDYLTFDHLHTQDVRRLVGTRGAAADLSPGGPVPPRFPNAKLIVQRRELELLRNMHPLQAAWYQPSTFTDLRDGALTVIDGDVLLGPGVALLATPVLAQRRQSFAVPAHRIGAFCWASSENVIATEFITPEHSRIPGIQPWLRTFGMEVVLNGNTLENTAQQYNSAIKEKTIVDRSIVDDRFLQFFPSSELTPSWHNPMAAPSFMHRRIRHGSLSPGADHRGDHPHAAWCASAPGSPDSPSPSACASAACATS